jgi:tetratricopeptide (TPR) repeat protein
MPRPDRAGRRRSPAPSRRIGGGVDIPTAPSAGAPWRAAVIVLAGSLTYLNSVSNPFVFDDESSILQNAQIRALWELKAVFSPERELPVAGRPVVNLSLAINYALGGFNTVGYHIWNIAVHVACAVLLFAVIRRALELPRTPATLRDRSMNIAFAAALIWVVHPLNSEPLNYITQRTESMMALFYLLTLYASIRALGARSVTWWQAIAIGSCALGMACKESMVTAPIVVVLFDWIFVFGSLREALRERRTLYVGLAATWCILAGLLSSGPRRRSAGFFTGVSPWTYLLNQAPLVTRYLGLVVWPASLVVNYGWPERLRLQDVLPSAIFIVTLLALTAAALRWRPQLGFLGGFFFITLAPTSSIVPIATEVGAERRMYLPMAALAVLGVVAVVWLWDKGKARLPDSWRGPKSVAYGAAALLCGVSMAFAVVTLARNREYASELGMAQTTLRRYPTPVAHHVLGEQLLAVGRRDEALAHIRQALPAAPRAHFTLGLELLKEEKLDEGIAEMRTFIREQPRLLQVIAAHEYIGKALIQQERWREAIEELKELQTFAPDNPAVHRLMADAFFGAQAFREAIEHYEAYGVAGGNDAGALNQLGIALGTTGQIEKAIAVFRRAAVIDAKNGAVQRNLANALTVHGELDAALEHAQNAVALQPGDAGSHHVLGRIREAQGRGDEAAAEFERAVELDPAFPDARDDLRRLQQRHGR